MKYATAASFLAVAVFGSAAKAQDWEGDRLAGLVYESIEGHADGSIGMRQFIAFGEDVFFSMDADGSASLVPGEFLNWGFGMHNVAEIAGRSAEFEAGMRVVFALWDRSGDGVLSAAEYGQSLALDFQRADVNDDAALSRQEFVSAFSVLAASRATIIPATAN